MTDTHSPLELEIRSRIELDGPLSIPDYMALCLAHPEHGYYTTGRPVGGRASSEREGGDFITAPEVSQMFGELVGVWCMEVWQALGRPNPFKLVEMGPGRGTLMKDLLRAARAMPGFLNAADVTLVEISPTLAEQQSLTLSDQPVSLTWIRDINALPEAPTILIANELLDALPFRQWVKFGDEWHERAVGLREGKLTFTTRPSKIDPGALPQDHNAQPEGTIYENAPAREGLVTSLGERVVRNTGAALFIDYGHLQPGFGDTFQAVRDHAYVDLLTANGQSDLTNHVDFAALVVAAKTAGCVVPTPLTQAEFLLSLGLLERAGALGSGRDEYVQRTLQTAVERLAGPNQMGNIFKALAFGSPASLGNRWPGFT